MACMFFKRICKLYCNFIISIQNNNIFCDYFAYTYVIFLILVEDIETPDTNYNKLSQLFYLYSSNLRI